MEAIATGMISKSVRIEVIGSVAVQMMQYTMAPTPEVIVYLLIRQVVGLLWISAYRSVVYSLADHIHDH